MFGSSKHPCVRAVPELATMMTAVVAVGGAALLGGAVLLSGAGSSRAEAPGATFAERFSIVSKRSDCPANGWPYFRVECLRMPDGSRARPVRVIGIDRPAFTNTIVAVR